MTTSERIEEQSFCYDPDFPPDVAEGLPLSSVKPASPQDDGATRRALRACGNAAASLARRGRSS
ncbi:MAG: hypothetical protein QOH76_1686 [Thermoleophilaceae bacterium]|jgi:hypothetical protein|nr:hypothetical protein [Thermoleophilaceae bacterium]